MKREEFWLGVCIYIILMLPTFAGPAVKKLNEHPLNVSFYPKVESFLKSRVWPLDEKWNPRNMADHRDFGQGMAFHALRLPGPAKNAPDQEEPGRG